MPGPPEWHIEKYEEAKRLIANAQAIIAARRTGNVVYLAECLIDLDDLAIVINAIRTTPP